MIAKVFSVLLLTLFSVSTAFAKCSVCGDGQAMGSSGANVPAGTISFLTEDFTCLRIELKAISEFTEEQCLILQNSTASTLCACAASGSSGNSTVPSEPESLPGVEDLATVTGQVKLTLISVTGTMDNDTLKTYDKVLTAFYKTFLNGTAIGVTATTVNQTAGKPPARRMRELQDVFVPLNTTVNITASVDTSKKWGFYNFSALCKNITKNHTDVLMELLNAADVAGNTTIFTSIEMINATSPSPAPSKPKDTKKKGLSGGVTAGILIGIFAVLCVAVYGASLAQGDRIMQLEVERDAKRAQREAAANAKLQDMSERVEEELPEGLSHA
jgi:hypothetical protein